jgi:hypothetical protein
MNAPFLRWIRDVAFYLGLGSLFTHELDAVPNHEWRGMPLLESLPDDTGMWVFIAAHVPLFAILIALVASKDERIRWLSRVGISVFLVLHGLLHALSAGEPTYEFSSRLSRVLIFGSSVLGALYLVLAFEREGPRSSGGRRPDMARMA